MFVAVLLLWLQCSTAFMGEQHEKPVTFLAWRGKCQHKQLALNDCNWCRCNQNSEFVCDARKCEYVDMFGHFNDAIQEFEIGMEGHGSWRSAPTACEPNVSYRRGDLMCVCNENGVWPNPVCRDIFRVLHLVEELGVSELNEQKCSAGKLYVVGCNICFCPEDGHMDPKLCTRQKCNDHNILRSNDEHASNITEEIYAECNPDYRYKLGCQTCQCLRNNRLLCENCKSDVRNPNSFCKNVRIGQIFHRGCNTCYCDKYGNAYCTAKKCLKYENIGAPEPIITGDLLDTDDVFDNENCIPGRRYKKGCNECYCIKNGDVKLFGCTKKRCDSGHRELARDITNDCVKDTSYELDCLVCYCADIMGVNTELCLENPDCKLSRLGNLPTDLDSLHGYCEPRHVYRKGCNICTCLSDGKSVKCTSNECDDTLEPVSVEFIPVTQKLSCSKGRSFAVDCNYCFCLSNGNAVCTTIDCRKNRS